MSWKRLAVLVAGVIAVFGVALGVTLVVTHDGSSLTGGEKVGPNTALINPDEGFNQNDPACHSGDFCVSDNPLEEITPPVSTRNRKCFSRYVPCVYAFTAASDNSRNFHERFAASPCGIIRRLVRSQPGILRVIRVKCVSGKRWKGVAFVNGTVPASGPTPKRYNPYGPIEG